MDPHIFPGFLTPSAARALEQAAAQAEHADYELQRNIEPVPDEFAAKITAYDGATGRCSWTMRSYNASGLRVDHPNGRTGTTTRNPAYPVGNGVMPPTAFPVDVWLRSRGFVGSLGGPVYEFDWICGCNPDPVGSSGGSIETDCCPSAPTPSVLTATTTSTCTDLNGLTVTVTHDGADWEGQFTAGGKTWNMTVYCSSGTWKAQIVNLTDLCGGTPGDFTVDSCDPLLLSNASVALVACGGCTGNVIVTVTE